MIKPLQLIRFIQINAIIVRHGLRSDIVGPHSTTLRLLSYMNPWNLSRNKETPAASIRIMLEKLGPIFVKFGQVLSTRRDLLPDDIADELEKLQDQVPPFSGAIAEKIIERELKAPIDQLFKKFDKKPLASASIAQVHAAELLDGSDVIIKVLRPNIRKNITSDLALMYLGARILRFFSKTARRLKPVELVAEFEATIYNELDLQREAANATQLRRNFLHSDKMHVPKIYWDYVTKNILVMERIYGIRISDIKKLTAMGVNFKRLAENGVEIFFTQVLRDSFFHADMHPGNLFVDVRDPEFPVYQGVDFGIMGTLGEEDQKYLAENLLAFFRRDYRRVAVLHVMSGWVPADTRVDQFEAAIRTVCEPIFERPLKDISFGNLLLQLFQTAEKFNMQMQPQLMLLQKTLLNIEGLGRQLYPDLDLWETAKPCLEKYMRERHSVKNIVSKLVKEFPQTAEQLMQLPKMVFTALQQHNAKPQPEIKKERNFKWWRGFAFGVFITFVFIWTLHIFSHWI